MKKIISLIAVMAMLLSLCTVVASAYNPTNFGVWTEYVAKSDTVAPGGQIVIELTDYYNLPEFTEFHHASYEGIFNYYGAADGEGDLVLNSMEVDGTVERDRADEDYDSSEDGYSDIVFNHAYKNGIIENFVPNTKTAVDTYRFIFDVPATAEIGTVYDFWFYGGNFNFKMLDANGDNYSPTFDLTDEANHTKKISVTVAEAAVEEPAVAPAAAKQEVRLGCEACEVSAGIRFISSIDTAAAGDGLEGYGIEITYNNVTKDVPAAKVYSRDGSVVYFTAVITNAPAGATFVAQPYAKYADGKVYATAGANA